MATRPQHSNDKAFNLTWTGLHLFNAACVAVILMNIGSARYHWLRFLRPPSEGDNATTSTHPNTHQD